MVGILYTMPNISLSQLNDTPTTHNKIMKSEYTITEWLYSTIPVTVKILSLLIMNSMPKVFLNKG